MPIPKNKKGLTIKQTKFVKEYVETGHKSIAYKKAYDTKGNPETIYPEAVRTASLPHVKEAIDAEMAKQGITMEKIIAPVAAALEAKTRIKSVANGETFEIDAPDLEMQLKGHDRAVRLMNFGQKKDEGGNTIIFNRGDVVAKKYVKD